MEGRKTSLVDDLRYQVSAVRGPTPAVSATNRDFVLFLSSHNRFPSETHPLLKTVKVVKILKKRFASNADRFEF